MYFRLTWPVWLVSNVTAAFYSTWPVFTVYPIRLMTIFTVLNSTFDHLNCRKHYSNIFADGCYSSYRVVQAPKRFNPKFSPRFIRNVVEFLALYCRQTMNHRRGSLLFIVPLFGFRWSLKSKDYMGLCSLFMFFPPMITAVNSQYIKVSSAGLPTFNYWHIVKCYIVPGLSKSGFQFRSEDRRCRRLQPLQLCSTFPIYEITVINPFGLSPLNSGMGLWGLGLKAPRLGWIRKIDLKFLGVSICWFRISNIL